MAASGEERFKSRIPIPQHGGYHQMCYTRFTDSQRVGRVIKSMQKLAAKVGLLQYVYYI